MSPAACPPAPAPTTGVPSTGVPSTGVPSTGVPDTGPHRFRSRPARASRVGAAPRPRVRPLAEVLAELVRGSPGATGSARGSGRTATPTGPDAMGHASGRDRASGNGGTSGTGGTGRAADDRGDATAAADEATLAAARPAALCLLQAVAEVLGGTRPATHLQRVCDEELYAATVVALTPPAGAPPSRGRLRGVRVCPLAPHAVEAAGVIHRDGRARALAARLERDAHGWRLTALEVG